MKIRKGFVSNSSSSSFIVFKEGLNDFEIDIVKKHIEYALKVVEDKGIKKGRFGYEIFGIWDKHEFWNFVESEHLILLYTDMNNFEISSFLKEFNINGKHHDAEYLEEKSALEEIQKLEEDYDNLILQKKI